ncbi:MAG: hypothetical protein JWN32_2869, partial [Solirubrobacterales bacterium]|nr:hypothetical protein [Solirubrobacterales bacterium]
MRSALLEFSIPFAMSDAERAGWQGRLGARP